MFFISLLISLFWITAFLIIFTYVIYPLILFILNRFIPSKVKKEPIEPRISVIISAYNEEKHLLKKLENTLSLDYPKHKLEIIVGSDGSIDRTAQIAQSFAAREKHVRILSFNVNRGKTSVQNDCVRDASGDILVFTDAASFMPADVLKKLIRNFADPRVGCVAGRMVYIDTDRNINTESQGFYWKYEMKIREWESGIGRMIGVDGPLYAMRKKNYVELKPQIISDFISPLLVLKAGNRVILEQEAIIKEEPTVKSEHEIKTRRRITQRSLSGIKSHMSLLNIFKSPVLALQIVFHKVIRWFVGPLLILNLLATICLASKNIYFFQFISALYIMLFAFGLVGYVLNRSNIKIRYFSIPYYFLLVNYAATLGIMDFIFNRQAVTWEPVR